MYKIPTFPPPPMPDVFGLSASASSSSSSSSASDRMDTAPTGRLDMSARAMRKRGMERVQEAFSGPPSFLFANLSAWEACIERKRDKDKPLVNPFPDKQMPAFSFPEILWCGKHQSWVEAFPTLTELSDGSLSHPQNILSCGICFAQSQGRLFSVVADLLRSNTKTVEELRSAWFAAHQDIRKIGAVARSKRTLELTRAIKTAAKSWVVYESLVWDMAEAERTRLKHLTQSNAVNWSEHVGASAAKLIENHEIFARYCSDAEDYREDERPMVRRRPMMFCSVHEAVGDAVPFRHPSRYRQECWICPIPRSRRTEDEADGSGVATGKSIFGLMED